MQFDNRKHLNSAPQSYTGQTFWQSPLQVDSKAFLSLRLRVTERWRILKHRIIRQRLLASILLGFFRFCRTIPPLFPTESNYISCMKALSKSKLIAERIGAAARALSVYAAVERRGISAFPCSLDLNVYGGIFLVHGLNSLNLGPWKLPHAGRIKVWILSLKIGPADWYCVPKKVPSVERGSGPGLRIRCFSNQDQSNVFDLWHHYMPNTLLFSLENVLFSLIVTTVVPHLNASEEVWMSVQDVLIKCLRRNNFNIYTFLFYISAFAAAFFPFISRHVL